jgi:hydrogenase maturation protein HypF
MQPAAEALGHHIEIRGTVQGVGFRPWVYRVAHRLGVAGRVRNDASGVVIDAFAGIETLRLFHDALRAPPAPASVQSLTWRSIAPEPASGFAIVPSTAVTGRRVSIAPDLATCRECERELQDPGNRRYGYPFINCTHCGPRFTIAEDVPYDRPATTMRSFRLCRDCAREYQDPADRRFHAEPNACPRCGPHLSAVRPDGTGLHGDPLQAAAGFLRAGRIVAVKGIGGFHLACDATSAEAVRRLRERKLREEKPFAVMVRDLDEARHLAILTNEEERLLASVRAPIVLVRKRPGAPLAAEVAPRNPLVGLLLAYSPLHHLLLAETERPLVMTSGNLSEEPIAYRDLDALARLGSIADLLLLHDREISTRCDDSVARVVAGKPLLMRRSRGWVPQPIRLARPLRRPVLACGAHLKNTFCLAVDDMAVLGPHVGDLDGPEVLQSLSDSVERMARFVAVKPAIVAHDLHPAYASTQYALARRETLKIGVQHHHAHIASALAEHGLQGPVIGVAFDGTGYGLDGTAWGGEVLLADTSSFERIATLRPLPLAGGEQAIRQPWRLALALLDDAFGGEAPLDGLPLFERIPPDQVRVVRQMVARGVNSPLAHGVGRLFDALGALVLARPSSSYEGQVATEWNLAADPGERSRYGFDIDRSASPWVLDPRPMVREIAHDVREGRPAAAISGAFHETLATATAALVRAAVTRYGHMPVVLTGGCFQNARLAESILAALSPQLDVLMHGEVPPGDGGIALGQAVIADSLSRS